VKTYLINILNTITVKNSWITLVDTSDERKNIVYRGMEEFEDWYWVGYEEIEF